MSVVCVCMCVFSLYNSVQVLCVCVLYFKINHFLRPMVFRQRPITSHHAVVKVVRTVKFLFLVF